MKTVTLEEKYLKEFVGDEALKDLEDEVKERLITHFITRPAGEAAL